MKNDPDSQKPIYSILARLRRVRQSGKGWMAECPGHDDRKPSLHVGEEDDGRIRMRCFAGCSREDVVRAMGLTLADLFPQNGNKQARRVVATYPYKDEAGNLLYQVLRHWPKTFCVRRPDGKGGWVYDLKGVRRVPYRLPDLCGQRWIAYFEGERDTDAAWSLGIAATTSVGGCGGWSGYGDQYLSALIASGVRELVVVPDNDAPGFKLARAVIADALNIGLLKVKLVELPDVGEKGDLSSWVDAGHTKDELLALVEAAPFLTEPPEERGAPEPSSVTENPWASAQTAAEFLGAEEAEPDWLERPILARGSIAEIFSPRGLGKTHVAYAKAVKLAKQGKRVLLLDRDNSRREVRRRLRAWGAADITTLRILTREKAPPLTDTETWRIFPFQEYDLVIIDSLDATTEGVGEKDSAKPSRAIAPILDIARRSDGPAILVLGNTIKSAEHSRGSGVIEDRADICYEVRDATDLKPTGGKPWWQELAPAGAGAWAERAARRKRRSSYRLAFVPSKFRIGEEPEPFILEIDLSAEPWTMRDVTAEIVDAGESAKAEAEAVRRRQLEAATAALAQEVRRRAEDGEPMLKDKGAVPFLMDQGLTQAKARRLLRERNGRDWRIKTITDRQGHPQVIFPTEPGSQSKTLNGKNTQSKTPQSINTQEGLFSVDRMDTGQRKTSLSEPALAEEIRDPPSFRRAFLIHPPEALEEIDL